MPRKVARLIPGFDGQREMASDIVPSPYNKGDYEAVVVNIRESSLASMRSRGQIDDAQFRAGDWFREVYERTRAGSMAVDPSREPVDTSGRSDPIPDSMIAASRLLKAAREELGAKPFRIVELICGQGFCLREVRHLGRSEVGIGWQLRNALDELAVWCGFASARK